MCSPLSYAGQDSKANADVLSGFIRRGVNCNIGPVHPTKYQSSRAPSTKHRQQSTRSHLKAPLEISPHRDLTKTHRDQDEDSNCARNTTLQFNNLRIYNFALFMEFDRLERIPFPLNSQGFCLRWDPFGTQLTTILPLKGLP